MLTRKKKAEIAKRLAVINYVAMCWGDDSWEQNVKCVLYHTAEIAYAVGQFPMMNQIERLVKELQHRGKDAKNESMGEMHCG